MLLNTVRLQCMYNGIHGIVITFHVKSGKYIERVLQEIAKVKKISDLTQSTYWTVKQG